MSEPCITFEGEKYIGEDAIYEFAESVIDEDAFDEMLDECYEDVDICGIKYAPSQALANVDEVAYRCAYSDWMDSVISEFMDELESASKGDTLYLGKVTVTVGIEEDEDEDEEED